MIAGGAVFADLIRALEPYLNEIVFVGGWVHALYLLEAEGESATTIGTYDIDVTLPPVLEARGRSPLIDLIKRAGFEVEAYDGASGLLEIYRDSMPLDLLTKPQIRANRSSSLVKIWLSKGIPIRRCFVNRVV